MHHLTHFLLQASWFERELARTLPSSLKTSIISANDVLLGRSSPPNDRHRRGKSFYHYTEKHGNVNGASGCPDRLLIIDDLDAVIGDADETDTSSFIDSEQVRALDAIISLMDDAINDNSHRCFVLGISRSSWAQLPPRLARVGRFEKVVAMLPPTLVQRRNIFAFWLSTLLPRGDDITAMDNTARQWAELLAPRTAGCVASDIRRICADALTRAAARMQLQLPHTQSTYEVDVSWEDVKEAAISCVPSQLSSMDVIPATLFKGNDHVVDSRTEFELAWKNFGGYDEVKKRLYRTVVRPWKYHIMETESSFDRTIDGWVDGILGASKPSGVLFHGPSGCGKTDAAMCLASSLGLHCVKVSFISFFYIYGLSGSLFVAIKCNSQPFSVFRNKVRASEVFNQWLGGSEAILRSIFSRARAAAPCILFFDELDSLAVNREGGESDVTSGVQSRILTTLLNEIDGITNVSGMQGVLVVAATNRLDAIDAALLRPGRLEEHVLLSYPMSSCIRQILMLRTAKMPIDSSVDFVKLSDRLEGSKATCAEIEGVCRDACMVAIRRCSQTEVLQDLSVISSDFDEAIYRVKGGTAYSIEDNCNISS
jgi:SpoVK/Ycf46/Vps4 family AAA+-type ATPase